MSLDYKGYSAGPIEFDEEQGLFSGIVIGLRDVVSFAGRDAEELKTAFRESIEDYLAFCAERGKEPDRPYSGNFLVRVDSSLHRKATLCAQSEGLSLNSWIARQIDAA
ncbi:type II toxin-antitoxin system HicB family antitoxin [Inquilinus sp. CAU 1745]|uniref:type II toxin-antitoxin system HicB family antitoxin n=1 Tax=Inquilinus sp. CAU 1745 TaxID=3140369 RepID=UPI00325A6CE4